MAKKKKKAPRTIVSVTEAAPACHIDLEVGDDKLTKLGEPFDPAKANEQIAGENQRVLPQNVYAALILAYLACEDASTAVIMTVIVAALPVILSFVAQLVLAHYLLQGVAHVDSDLALDCSATDFGLQAIALSAFVGMALRHAIDVLNMHLWLNMFHTSNKHEGLMLQKYRDKLQNTHHRPTTGITRGARAFFYLFALLPELVTTVFVLIAGSGAVLRSANRFDLVLNSVAAVFVLELDNAFYLLLIPQSARNGTEGIPPLNKAGGEGGGCKGGLRQWGIVFWPWLVLATVVVLDVPLYQGWCVLSVNATGAR